MTKQEFLAMSLPYELHGMTQKRLGLINGIEYEKELPIIWRGEKISGRCGFGIRPILRPLSDLTKEIEHKGEKFVPIVELAKMVFDSPFSDPFCFKSGSCYAARYKEYEFGYNHKEYSFYLFDQELVNFKFLPNQLGLFKKLIEWHFAVGLNSDDYIDLNSLEANPYK